MSEPFLAEIRLFGFNFPPRGWALCDGQILPINQNQSLYSLLGTTYGGDGRTTFALPELRGRTPMHIGTGPDNNVGWGQRGGAEAHTLTNAELPSHRHVLNATGDQGTSTTVEELLTDNNVLASQARGGVPFYSDPSQLADMHNQTIEPAGQGQAHNNMQPSLTISFAIALQGVFPSRD